MSNLSRRDFLKLAGAGLSALALGRWVHPTQAAPDPRVVFFGPRDQPFTALTFDDCYLVREMHHLEEALTEYPSLKLTLFPVGEALLSTSEKDPGLWPRLFAAGHEFGYHSFDHTAPSEMKTAAMLADYDRWLAALQQATGANPPVRFARPPFGDRSYSFLELCVERDLIAAMWSTDWPAILDPYRKHAARVEGGDVIIFHSRDQDIDSLPAVMNLIGAAGLYPVTMSGLIFGAEIPFEQEPCDLDPKIGRKFGMSCLK